MPQSSRTVESSGNCVHSCMNPGLPSLLSKRNAEYAPPLYVCKAHGQLQSGYLLIDKALAICDNSCPAKVKECCRCVLLEYGNHSLSVQSMPGMQ